MKSDSPEANVPPPAPTAPPPVAVAYSSQSQWSLIWKEFRKRKLALFSLFVILFLLTVSIAAPFLANGKPIYYRGYNQFEYRESVRTLLAVMNLLVESRPEKKNPETKEAPKKPKGDPLPVLLEQQFDRITEHLRDDAIPKLNAARDKALPLAREIHANGAAASSEAVKALRQLRIELRRELDGAAAPLTSRSHWPVIAALDWQDIALLAFNAVLLLFPVWLAVLRRIVPAERAQARVLIGFFLFAVVPLLVGGLWKLTVPNRLDRTNYKAGVLASDPAAGKAPVVFESAVWALVPYSVDEIDLDDTYGRPELMRYLPHWMLGIWTELPPPPARETPDVDEKAKSSIVSDIHWMGTDGTGRDILARMIWGGRVSLSVGIVATAIELILGIVLGALAGYFRGWVDMVISRVIEIVICFPSFFLILTIVAFLGPSIYNIMLVIGLTGWTGLARLVRGEFLRLSGQEFVLSARALGYTPARIIFRHVLPNAMAPVLVTATFAIAGAILTESALSFLNLGITEPTPSWGGILYTGRNALQNAPWIIYFPGLAVFITITAYNLVGEAFRDAADPRLRGRM